MKQEKLIHQLKMLRKIEPRADTIAEIKQQASLQLRVRKNVDIWVSLRRFRKHFSVMFDAHPFIGFGTAIALAVLALLSVSSGLLPKTATTIYLSVAMATLPNQYEKAKFALSYTQAQIDALSAGNTAVNTGKLTDLSREIAFADAQMSGLKLMGEKGKYTSGQCKELYRQYHASLENLDHMLLANSETKQSIGQLHTQISDYEKHAEQKLNLY